MEVCNLEVSKILENKELTKTTQIIELALLGLMRTEIRDVLGLRYQHVRNVLVNAGMGDIGLKNTTPITANKFSSLSEKAEMKTENLYEYGFKEMAKWTLADNSLLLKGDVQSVPGLYAFCILEEIFYLGLTTRSLSQRMSQYKSGHASQKTNVRIKKLLIEKLNKENQISILTCIPKPQAWNGLSLNIAPSLEIALIQKAKPSWNIQGK